MTTDPHSEGFLPTGVLITTDPEFRDQFLAFQAQRPREFQVVQAVEEPFTAIGDPEIEKIRSASADLVVVDLESDPHIGLKFVQYLVDSGAASTVMCAGRDLSPDLLLQAMQAGVAEILPKPVSEESIDAALRRIWKRTGKKVESARRAGPGKAIALFGTKGGVGTTSLATNLAVEVHRVTRKRTLLLDLDVELGETSLMLGMDPQFSLTDLIRNFHRVDAGLLASYIEHHDSGIDLLAAPFKPGDYEAVGQERIRQIIRFLREQYDYVIMDTPKSFHPVSIAVLEEADRVLLITTPTLPALRNLVRSLPLIRQITGKKKGGTIELVVNRFEAGNLISMKEIEETAGMPVLHSIRNDYEAVMSGINEGKPAVLRGPSIYAKSVRALAGVLTETPVQDEDRKGILGGFIGALKSGR